MVALKSLLDNSNISIISVGICLLSFVRQVEILLVLAMMSEVSLKPGYSGYYVIRLWILLSLSALADLSIPTLVGEREGFLVTARWEWKSRFPTGPPLIPKSGQGCLLQLGGSWSSPLGSIDITLTEMSSGVPCYCSPCSLR